MNCKPASIDIPDGSISIVPFSPTRAVLTENIEGTVKSYSLVNIKAVPGRLDADVDGQPFGIEPHLSIILNAADVRMTISKSWIADGDTDYTLTKADHDILAALVANFAAG